MISPQQQQQNIHSQIKDEDSQVCIQSDQDDSRNNNSNVLNAQNQSQQRQVNKRRPSQNQHMSNQNVKQNLQQAEAIVKYSTKNQPSRIKSSLTKKKLEKPKIQSNIFLPASIAHDSFHSNFMYKTQAKNFLQVLQKQENSLNFSKNRNKQSPVQSIFVGKQIDKNSLDDILNHRSKSQKQKQNLAHSISKGRQKTFYAKNSQNIGDTFFCISQPEKTTIPNQIFQTKQAKRSISLMKIDKKCLFAKHNKKHLAQNNYKVKNRAYTLHSTAKKLNLPHQKDTVQDWGNLKIKHTKCKNLETRSKLIGYQKNPYQRKFIEDQKKAILAISESKKQEQTTPKSNQNQIISVNDLRIDPVEMYQIKNNVACEQFKRNVYDNEPQFKNYSSHYFISHGDIFLKQDGYKKPDQIRFEASFRSFASSVEGSNLHLTHNGDQYLSKQLRNRTSGLSIHPTPSLANLDEGFEANKRFVQIENSSHANRLDTQNSQQMRKSDNEESNKNSGLSIHQLAKGSVFCRRIKETDKLYNLYGASNQLSLAEIQRSIAVKEKNFLSNLRTKEFYVILWDENSLNNLSVYQNPGLEQKQYRRKSYIGLCTGLQVTKQQSRSFSAIPSLMSYENIISEAERKQQIRKQSMTLKFELVLNYGTAGKNEGFNNTYLHFEMELKRRTNAGGSKLECYKEKLFVACLSSNLDDFMKYLRKLTEALFIRQAINGKKLKLCFGENNDINQLKSLKRDELYEHSKVNNIRLKQKKVTIEHYQMSQDSIFKTTRHQKRQSQLQSIKCKDEKQDCQFQCSQKQKQGDQNYNQPNQDSIISHFVRAEYSYALNTALTMQKLHTYLQNKVQPETLRSVKNVTGMLNDNIIPLNSIRYKGFISIQKKYFLVSSKISFPLMSKLSFFSFVTQINHELLNQTCNMILSCSKKFQQINWNKLNKKDQLSAQNNIGNQLIQFDVLEKTYLGGKYSHCKGQGFRQYYNFITEISQKCIASCIFGISSQLNSNQMNNFSRSKERNISILKQKASEKQFFNLVRVRIIQCEESINKKIEEEPGIGQRKRHQKKKHCKVMNNTNEEANALYFKHIEVASQGKIVKANSQQTEADAGVSAQNKRQVCSNKRTKEKLQNIYRKKDNLNVKNQFYARSYSNFYYRFEVTRSKNLLLANKQHNNSNFQVNDTILVQCIIDKSKLSHHKQDLLIFKKNEQVDVKFNIRTTQSLRFYVLNSSINQILLSTRSQAKKERLNLNNMKSNYCLAQNNAHTKISLKQLQLFATKFQKYRTFVSTDYRTIAPVYQVVYRKIKKLQTQLYVVITIVHSETMKCAKVKIYASWLQKTFFFKISFEKINQKMKHKYEQRTAKYWDQIGDCYTRIMKNTYFKQNVEIMTLRLKQKNMRLYNTIIRKSVQGNLNYEERLKNLPNGRAIKMKNKSKGTNNQIEDSKRLSNCETILYQQIACENLKSFKNQQYQIVLYSEFIKELTNSKNQKNSDINRKDQDITIQISRGGKFTKLQFTWSAHQNIEDLSRPEVRTSTPRILNTNIIFSLIEQSLQIAPGKIYKQLVQRITDCIKSDRIGKYESVIKRLKNLFEKRCRTTPHSNCYALYRKRMQNQWFCIEDHGDTNSSKKIILKCKDGQQQQIGLPIMGFQNCVPFSKYNRRLITRLYKTVSKSKY